MEERMKALKQVFKRSVKKIREGEHSYLRGEMCGVVADALVLANFVQKAGVHMYDAHADRPESPDVEVASATFQSTYKEAAISLHLEKDSQILCETLLGTAKFLTGREDGVSILETALSEANEELQSPSFKRRQDNG
jgi:hypothetical protein